MKAGRPATQEELMLQFKPKAAHHPPPSPKKKKKKKIHVPARWPLGKRNSLLLVGGSDVFFRP